MFPQLLAFVAIFLLMTTIADVFPAIGLNSQIGLIMVYLGGALGVNTLPHVRLLQHRARLDRRGGQDRRAPATRAIFFFTIILRWSPDPRVVGLLSFIGTMNDFVLASVILVDPDKQTHAVGLYQFVSQETATNWSVFAAERCSRRSCPWRCSSPCRSTSWADSHRRQRESDGPGPARPGRS